MNVLDLKPFYLKIKCRYVKSFIDKVQIKSELKTISIIVVLFLKFALDFSNCNNAFYLAFILKNRNTSVETMNTPC